MSAKTWNAWAGLFSSPWNWSPDTAPAAGDNLYIQSGTAIMVDQTFGSDDVPSTISLAGPQGSDTPELVMLNVTLKNVRVDEATTSSANQPNSLSPHGNILVAGSVTNDGGTIAAQRGNVPGGSLDVTIAPGSTLINKGSIYASPGGQLTISGSDGSTLENDGTISAAGGDVIISTHLTGTGDVFASRGQQHSPYLELKDAVDAGQTFHVSQAAIQIDQPASFLGQIDGSMQQTGVVQLEGLAAASWDVNGSSIEFFDGGGSVIDTLRFTAPQDPSTLAVYSEADPTYGNAVVVGSSQLYQPSTGTPLLPYHSAPA